MKKNIFLLIIGVMSLTLLSFTSDGDQSVTLLDNGNYLMENINFSADDEAILESLESMEASAGFFVRCYSKCQHKFTHATIAGGGCCTSQVINATADEIAAADEVRGEVDAIMQKYMLY